MSDATKSSDTTNSVARWWSVTAQAEHATRGGWSGSRQVPTFFLDGHMLGITDVVRARLIARDVVSAGGLFGDLGTFHVSVAPADETPETTAIRHTVDDAISMVIDELNPGDSHADLIELVRNAIHDRIDNSGATFADVVKEHYDRTPNQVREWWDNWR